MLAAQILSKLVCGGAPGGVGTPEDELGNRSKERLDHTGAALNPFLCGSEHLGGALKAFLVGGRVEYLKNSFSTVSGVAFQLFLGWSERLKATLLAFRGLS